MAQQKYIISHYTNHRTRDQVVVRGYDLQLPEDFEPHAGDGEVESFSLMSCSVSGHSGPTLTPLAPPQCRSIYSTIHGVFGYGNRWWVLDQCNLLMQMARGLSWGDEPCWVCLAFAKIAHAYGDTWTICYFQWTARCKVCDLCTQKRIAICMRDCDVFQFLHGGGAISPLTGADRRVRTALGEKEDVRASASARRPGSGRSPGVRRLSPLLMK